MALSASQLKQVVSARVTGVGATSTHVIGGTNTITDDVDIAFSFTLKCKVTASNSVVLRYHNQDKSNKPTLEHSSGAYTASGNAITSTQAIGSAGEEDAEIIQDPSMADVAAMSTIVAVYYEAPASNGGIITITSSDNALGDVNLKSAGGSALIVTRITADSTALLTTFSFASASVGDIIKVVVLGNSS